MGWMGPIGFLLQRFAARLPDLIVADSKLTAARLTAWLGIDPNRVVVISPGVQFDSPSPLSGLFPSVIAGEGRGGEAKKYDCIFVGRLLAHKHVDVLLQVLARLPGVTALIIGTGPEKVRLLALSSSLGVTDRVTFESPTDRTRVLEYLQASRLFVSLSTREGFGVSVLEANACGVPALVVQHADNAATELIDDGVNGIIATLAPDALADQIRRYLADPAAQHRMVQAARSNAARYTWDAYVTSWEAAVGALLPKPLEKAA
jgi:glycosyltransferase involved in cell wall biosynthesis